MSIPSFHRVGKTPLTLLRGVQGEYVDGRWVDGEDKQVCIMANIQPATAHETLLLSESDRTRYTIKVFSCSEIRTMKEGTNGWDADTFEWQDDLFEVMKVKHWNMRVLDHYQALACLVPRTQEEE